VLDSRSVLPDHIPNAHCKRDTCSPSYKGLALFPATLVKSAIVAGIAWRYLGVLQAGSELLRSHLPRRWPLRHGRNDSSFGTRRNLKRLPRTPAMRSSPNLPSTQLAEY
jgi:hypothetical protein